jgi:hypothetical protein
MKTKYTSHQLLIDERPLILLPSLIKLVGMDRAAILQQVHFLCGQPRSGQVLSDGFNYIWNTYEDWRDQYFDFWSVSSVKKHFAKLEKQGLLIAKQPNKGKWDRTKYYRVNYDELNLWLAADDPDIEIRQPED